MAVALAADAPLKLTEEIQRDARTVLFRGVHGAAATPCRVRVPANRHARSLAAIRNEMDLRDRLGSDCFDRVVGMAESVHGPALLLQDTAALPLTELLTDGPMPLDPFLDLGVGMAAALAALHEQGLIHNDVRPANFWVDTESGNVTLGNFARTAPIPEAAAPLQGLGNLDADLRYLSPEQTGRMNRPVDERADLYSLGICFYEMLAGQVPFTATDPMGWVHCHIARDPRPLRELRPEIPEPLAAIVMRLLTKAAEQRYQLAATLAADLAAAREEWRSSGRIVRLNPTQSDRPQRLVLPQRLYGRDREMAQMLAAFDRACLGQAELLMVAGNSGIGKSVLVRELHRPLTGRRGFYAEGKFDQLRRDVPFLAFLQPMRDLLRQILTEPPEILAHWTRRLTMALDGNGGVLAQVLPELELVAGRQPAPAPLPPAQAQNRFQQAVSAFLAVFAAAEHPLLLFLDDLQWADVASLKLLESLFADPELRHLLVVGAYRDHEVEPSHPLMRTLAAVGQATRVTTVVPQPLGPAHVRDWLADAFGTNPSDVGALADLLARKSGGNPFFLGQLTMMLAATGVARFDPRRGSWSADVAAVERAGLPDDVAALLADRLCVLPVETRDVLRHAACIGSRFELSLLAAVCGRTPGGCIADLGPALRSGYSILVEDEGGTGNVYRFAHDRLHKAAYLLTPDNERARVHLDLGRRMRDDPELAARYPFEVVRHLNQGLPLITAAGERAQLALLNHTAAARARASAAFDIAYGLLVFAMEALPEGSDRDTRWRLWMDAAEAAYLTQDFDAFRSLRAALEEMATESLRKAEVQELVVVAEEARNDFRAALAAALEGLRLLDVRLSEATAKRDTLLLLLRLTLAMAGRSDVAALAARPDMRDPRQLQIMRLLGSAIRASYSVASPLLPVLSLQGALLTLRHGMTPYATICFTGSALIYIGLLNDIARGSRLGELAMRLGTRYGVVAHVPNHILVVHHWTQPLREMAPLAAGAFRHLLASGAYDRAGLCVMAEMTCRATHRNSLEDEARATQAALTFAQRRGLRLIAETARNPLALIERLRRPELGGLNEILPYDGTADSRTGEIAFNVRQMATLAVFGRPDLMRDLAAQVRPALRSVLGSAWIPLFHWMEALALLDGVRTAAPGLSRRAALRRVRKTQALFRLWTRFAAVNALHRTRLLEAETEVTVGQVDRAGRLYVQAIELAVREGFIADAALAAELYARALQSQGREHRAAVQLREALLLYRRWGAAAKVEQLRSAHPDAFEGIARESQHEEHAGFQAMEVSTVTKVGQAIAGELKLERLIDRVLDLAMENAGARYAALTLEADGGPVLAAERSLGADTGTGPPAEAAAEPGRRPVAATLPDPLLLYVARTLEPVLIEDARVQTRFPPHPRWSRATAVSVLCLPVIHQGRFSGALYLENDLTAGAFTGDRVELLQVLASQAAIALANARLFQALDRARAELLDYNRRLEQIVSERTADLAQRSVALEESLETLRATQAQLVQKEKLASLGGLVAGVAHEINTPLGVAVTATSYFADRLEEVAAQVAARNLTRSGLDSFIAELRTGLKTVQLNLSRSADLVQSFKQVAVNQSGDRAESIDLAAHVRGILPGLEAVLNGGGARLETSLQAGLMHAVAPEALPRILTHLVQNAATHAFAGIVDPTLRITLSRQGGMLRLVVADNGVGMTDAVRERAFDPFFTTRRGAGLTGLGLHIVHNLVTGSFGGTVTLDSAPGAGTVVIVEWPGTGEPEAATAGAQVPSADG